MTTHQQAIIDLTRLLERTRIFWNDSPFCTRSPAWLNAYPQLAESVLQLTDACVDELERDPTTLQQFMRRYIPEIDTFAIPFANHPATQDAELNAHWHAGISGRKRQQIEAFIQHASLTDHQTKTIVDWCGGKGHLSRSICRHTNHAMRVIEKDSSLFESGANLAAKARVDAGFEQTDVLLNRVNFHQTDSVVALHACGDLHLALLKQWLHSESSTLNLSPCCYHLWKADTYKPLSATGQQQNLKLSPQHLHLAVEETVNAPSRETNRRDTLKAWRLGFDLLQRDLNNHDKYLPSPSINTKVTQQCFPEFVTQLAAHHKITLPVKLNYADYEKAGYILFKQVQRLELVRHAFRRPLEAWLVLDIANYLEEHSCSVQLIEFCDRKVTPRNILIVAKK